MKRKSLVWLLCSAMTALMLAGCGNSAETADSPQPAESKQEEQPAQESAPAESEADAQTADGELPTITFVHGYYPVSYTHLTLPTIYSV